MAVTLILEYASEGWHIRWRTFDTAEFKATRGAFKNTLSFGERYWDQEAFEGKGGWWVAYGALAQVGHLFNNYQEMRDQLEAQYWRDYWRQQQEERERFTREQELARQRRERKTQRQRERRQEQRQQDQWKEAEEERRQKEAEAARRKAEQQRREEVKLPQTLEEALAILHLTSTCTAEDIKRAYRKLAFKCHPDHGGSHAAMCSINAAYELALEAA